MTAAQNMPTNENINCYGMIGHKFLYRHKFAQRWRYIYLFEILLTLYNQREKLLITNYKMY